MDARIPAKASTMSAGTLARALITGIDHHALRWGQQAAIRLLVAHGTWLHHSTVRDHIGVDTAATGMPFAWIRWARLALDVDRATAPEIDLAVMRLACHLAGSLPEQPDSAWALNEIVEHLDITTRLLASRAVAMAALGPDAVGPLT